MKHVLTRQHYIEHLVDAALEDAAEMDQGFMAWCADKAPLWREQGHDVTWIRLRISSARSSHALCQSLRKQHLTPAQQRKALREMYETPLPGFPDMYDLMLERMGQTRPDETIHGNTEDLLQRYTLRVLVYAADKASWEAHSRWAGQPATPYQEDPDITQIRDLSTVEELELALGMCQCLIACFSEHPPLDNAAIHRRIDRWTTQARADFISKHGYKPEEATTPFTPVTVTGPVDHDEYMVLLRESEQEP